MRPTRIELEGFTAFRDRTVIELGDVDYFALVGPTGSGKSSIVDAITFALYGCVARYDDDRLVAPVITQGENEVRVRVDFAIGGDGYSVVRVARRTKTGASAKEVRLQRGDEVLAASAKEVDRTVVDLLGLTFQDFCRSVVLPQGAFARFLRDTAAERQDLLVRLLKLEVYGRMAQRANTIAAEAEMQGRLFRQRLDTELAGATPEALDAARERAARLRAVRGRVADAQPVLVAIDAAGHAARTRYDGASGWAARLRGVDVPGDIAGLRARRGEAAGEVDAATREHEAATGNREKAFAAWKALPDKGQLAAVRADHEALVRVLGDAARATEELAAAEGGLRDATAAVEAAEEDVGRARLALERAQHDNLAHTLAGTLVAGEPCPVCRQVVPSVPAVAASADVDRAKAALAAAEEFHRERAAAAGDADRRRAAAAARLSDAEAERRRLDERLGGQPTAAEVGAQLAAIERAEAAVAAAIEQENEAGSRLQAARRALAALDADVERHRVAFESARDALAPLGPPPSTGTDLAGDWEGLAAWADAAASAKEAEAVAAEKELAELRARRLAVTSELAVACAEAGVAVAAGVDDLLLAVHEAEARARAGVEAVERDIATADGVRAQVATLAEEQAVARALGRHLGAKGFQRWIIREALRVLVADASLILRELSGDQYSLGIDDASEFVVVDHRNADETRSAKTLSGGETFLASLSLALALSQRLRELAAEGAARLDAIFLDEGFGTLDPETLDTVAAAIDQLAAGGRMVGVITHVRELAERIPVRFEVAKGDRTSAVRKVVL